MGLNCCAGAASRDFSERSRHRAEGRPLRKRLLAYKTRTAYTTTGHREPDLLLDGARCKDAVQTPSGKACRRAPRLLGPHLRASAQHANPSPATAHMARIAKTVTACTVPSTATATPGVLVSTRCTVHGVVSICAKCTASTSRATMKKKTWSADSCRCVRVCLFFSDGRE